MIVTEEEAKTKRCQEGYAASPGAALNPVTDYVHQSFVVPSMSAPVAGAFGTMATTATPITAPIFCLGSACMAWRWVIGDRADTYGRENKDKGYCGKAVKP